MSAFVVNPYHVAILAAFAVRNDAELSAFRDYPLNERASKVAALLMNENIRSVCCRYSWAKPEDSEADLRLAVDLAGQKIFSRIDEFEPVDILKMCQCLDYQSCETEDWLNTLAYRQLCWIIDAAHKKLPGWETAPWEFIPEEETA